MTCAVDMYLILRYLMSFDAFVEISGVPTFTMPAKEKHRSPSVLVSQNAALSKSSGGNYYRSAMQGGMCDVTAYKKDSGNQSYVSWANQDGATYIFCVMQSPDTCDTFGYASMMTLLPSTGDGSVTQKYFHLPDYVCAPIRQGDVVGTVELKLAGETIGVVNLIAGQDVDQNALLLTVAKIREFLGSLYLKVVIVLSVLSAAIYGLWLLLNRWNHRRPTRKIHRR